MPAETPATPPIDVPGGWECTTLDRLVEPSRGISYGIVQPGKHDGNGVPILRVNNVRNGRIDTTDVLRVSSEIESKYERTRLRGGEVLLSLVGTLGECAVVPDELRGWNVARAIAVIPLKPETDPRWVRYCLRSTEVQGLMRAWATTTVQATLNLRDVRRLPVLLAPEPLRAAITDAVSSLDDKIEQNRRTALALERLARAIFRAWFVDFEPVKAKAAGAASFPSMPQEVFEDLPTRFSDSELGSIPEGWEVKPIGEAVSVKGGGTPSTRNPEYWNGGVHCWATPRDMSRLSHPVLLDTERRITDAGVACISSGLLPVGTVLLSSRAPVGYLAVAAVPTAINQGFIAMVCDGPLSPLYVLNWTHQSLDAIKARASGTTFPEISKRNFRPLPVVVPQPDVVTAYAETVDPMFELLTACARESERLARDARLLTASAAVWPSEGAGVNATSPRDVLEQESLVPSEPLRQRRHDRDEETYRTWCEETYGMVALGDEVFHPADVLDKLATDVARRGRDDALSQACEDIEQAACERFPSLVAVPFHRFLEGPRAPLTRLHRLRDTWESLVRLLAAIALAEASSIGAGLAPLRLRESTSQGLRDCRKRDLRSDKLAIRIGLAEAVLIRASAAGADLEVAKILPVDVIGEVRRLNSIRNGFSHEATKSDKQAEALIEEAYPSVRELLLDLRDLQDVSLFRVKSVDPTAPEPVAEIERLFGHSQSQRIADLPLDGSIAPIVLGASKVGDLDRVLARIGQAVIDLSPFVYAVDDDTGHHTRLLEFKMMKESKWHLECVGDSSTHHFDEAPHEALLCRYHCLLAAGSEEGAA